MHHSDCLSQATFTFLVRVYLSPVECDPANQFMCADQAKCVDIRFCCEANHLPDCADGSEENTATLQVRLCVLCCVGAGIVECLKGWRCVVRRVEGCGGRMEGCGERVEVCGRCGGMWRKGWRGGVRGWKCVGGVEGCGGRGGGVW